MALNCKFNHLCSDNRQPQQLDATHLDKPTLTQNVSLAHSILASDYVSYQFLLRPQMATNVVIKLGPPC